MILFFLTFFILFSLVNYYIIRRGLQALEIAPKFFRILFLIVVLIASLSYVFARAVFANSNTDFYDFLLFVGSIWYAFLMYGIIAIILSDITRFIIKKTKPYLFEDIQKYKKIKLYTFFVVSIFISGLVLYGYNNAQNIKVKEFFFSFQSEKSELKNLRIVFFSDSHLTPINDGVFAEKLIKTVNSLNPDLILLGGDIIDDNSNNLNRHNISEKLKQLRAPLGIFTCNGNHEYIVGIDDAQQYLEKSNIIILRDTVLTIANTIQVISRDDRQRNRFVGSQRKSLKELNENVNKDYPSILLDHQPFELDSSAYYGVNLHLSGHTHHGQMIPANLITSMIYEISWGYGKKENTHFYVTSGAGTWGPPVKIGTDAEIILFNIKFD
ncbi:MAG TPA: metallophosphoesterase [Ignavibacteriaceae bacterium]|nr:metallophosphoesterase [Ignavibacteriaceae bacterium]